MPLNSFTPRTTSPRTLPNDVSPTIVSVSAPATRSNHEASGAVANKTEACLMKSLRVALHATGVRISSSPGLVMFRMSREEVQDPWHGGGDHRHVSSSLDFQ